MAPKTGHASVGGECAGSDGPTFRRSVARYEAGGLTALKDKRDARNKGKTLQIPPQPHRYTYVRTKVKVYDYEDGGMAVFHGIWRLGRYDANGRLLGTLSGSEVATGGGGTEKRTLHVFTVTGHFICYRRTDLPYVFEDCRG